MYKTEMNKTMLELKTKKKKSAEGQDWFHVISHCKLCANAWATYYNLKQNTDQLIAV